LLQNFRGQQYWPVVATGVTSLLLFLWIGQAPVTRALAMAGTIAALTLILQRFGTELAVIGSATLTFTPAFWNQVVGSSTADPLLVMGLLLAASVIVGVFYVVGRKPAIGLAIGVSIFAVLFWTVVGTPRSLRITAFLSSWLLYLLMDAVLRAHPRPEEPTQRAIERYHLYGFLFLLSIGIFNDPLFTLMVPSVVLTLVVIKAPAHWTYWAVFVLIALFGTQQLITQYASSTWWSFSAQQARELGIVVPYLIGDGWRDANRWLDLFQLFATQFSLFGIVLMLFGLSRMARWYPPLGIVTMVGFSSYMIFGLLYLGRDVTVHLIPMFIIIIVWITYGIYAIGQWIAKSSAPAIVVRWAALLLFIVLPVFLLSRVLGLL
jgi:hypothetical protein